MHVQETSGLGVGLCGFLCVFLSSVSPYRHRSPSKPPPSPSVPTCSTSPPEAPKPHRNRASNASNSLSVLLMANRCPSARPFGRAQRTLVSIGKCKECVNV